MMHYVQTYIVFISSLLDMPFGGGNQKFPMGGMGFEGQQGMGSSPGGLLGNEMVTYPTFSKIHEDLFIVCVGFFCWRSTQLILNTKTS